MPKRRTQAAAALGDPATSGVRGSTGSLSCAGQVENDSASLASVSTASRREGSAKFPVTPQASRAGRRLGSRVPGRGGGEQGRGGRLVLRVSKGSPPPPLLSPCPFLCRPRECASAGGWGLTEERVNPGSQRNLLFPKPGESASREGVGAAFASLCSPDIPATATRRSCADTGPQPVRARAAPKPSPGPGRARAAPLRADARSPAFVRSRRGGSAALPAFPSEAQRPGKPPRTATLRCPRQTR